MTVFLNSRFKLKLFQTFLSTLLLIGFAKNSNAQDAWGMVGEIDSHVNGLVYSMVKDHSGNIYAGSVHGVFKYDGTKWTELGEFINGLHSSTNQGDKIKVAVDNAGNVYASGDSSNGDAFIAKFNGTNWTKLPSTGLCLALVTDPFGNLYASLQGGSINKWDGIQWTTIFPGNGYDFVYSMACDGTGKLYTVGSASSGPYAFVHMWDGVSWTELYQGAGFNNNYYGTVLVDDQDNLYASFYNANTLHIGVAKWHDQAWTELGTGVAAQYGIISTLATDAQHNIYAAGGMTNSSGKKVVAKWDGTSWTEVGTGANGLPCRYNVDAIVVDNTGSICATLDNYEGWGDDSSYIAKWNGTNWGDELGRTNKALHSMGTSVIAAGASSLYARVGSPWLNIAKWDGSTWSEEVSTSNSNPVSGFKSDGNNVLYATGSWLNANGKHYVAKWNGSSWIELGSGSFALNPDSAIYSIAIDHQNNIYAAGSFTNSNSKKYVAKWNGTNWTELGTGTASLNANNYISTLVSDSAGNIYAFGAFTNASGKQYIAKWNGISWTELGVGSASLNANGNIYFLTADNLGNVYAAGAFTNASGKQYVAKWNGTNWTELGVGGTFIFCGIHDNILADPAGNVYASCYFCDGHSGVAKWDGFAWSETGIATDAIHDGIFSGAAGLAMDRSGTLYASTAFNDSRDMYEVVQLAAPGTYTFTGNGNWSNAANWTNSLIPPANLPAGSKIIINPIAGGQCILNSVQTILPNAFFTVSAGAHFVVTGNLINNQ